MGLGLLKKGDKEKAIEGLFARSPPFVEKRTGCLTLRCNSMEKKSLGQRTPHKVCIDNIRSRDIIRTRREVR